VGETLDGWDGFAIGKPAKLQLIPSVVKDTFPRLGNGALCNGAFFGLEDGVDGGEFDTKEAFEDLVTSEERFEAFFQRFVVDSDFRGAAVVEFFGHFWSSVSNGVFVGEGVTGDGEFVWGYFEVKEDVGEHFEEPAFLGFFVALIDALDYHFTQVEARELPTFVDFYLPASVVVVEEGFDWGFADEHAFSVKLQRACFLLRQDAGVFQRFVVQEHLVQL